MPRLLIVDDELGSRESLRLIFSRDHAVLCASTAEEALAVLGLQQVDLVLLDVVMPGRSGLDLLRQIHAEHVDLPVIMISASTAISPVVESIQQGAVDFVGKPFDADNIRHLVRRALETKRLHRQVAVLEHEVSATFPTRDIVGRCSVFTAVIEQLRQAAATDATVLIQGESGTGKELAARLLHAQSPRCEEPFVAVHCAALPENLLESELFGHEKGAFTSADRQKPGRFELAGSGTLFFDEIGEMSAVTQVKLLRVLQEREFMRVGGTRLLRTNARIVAATGRDLRKMVADGLFREDLFYRLNVVQVRLPPLRERREDIPLLLAHFLERLGPVLHASARGFEPEALRRLCDYAWPGNVRELRNVVERVLVLHGRDEAISASQLPEEFQSALPARAAPDRDAPAAAAEAPPQTGQTLEAAVSAYERQLIAAALRQAGGVQTRAAETLGTTRRILRYKMGKLGLAEQSLLETTELTP
ncbi:MAG TPA: sigma-54 dependent transcriptional regulator [Kiritimatiellia bacterium]|nr:sigma-54 dependent transcriptional regulator [Kiritimatiellia bacterium]HPS09312.1 sigma-54 dependent transcriptional regulator [Kiritimatiellia bacterium]